MVFAQTLSSFVAAVVLAQMLSQPICYAVVLAQMLSQPIQRRRGVGANALLIHSPPPGMSAQEEKMTSVPLLVFANKQDLVGAHTADEIADQLNLIGIRDRPWQIQACSAKAGDGLQQGMEWVMKQVGVRRWAGCMMVIWDGRATACSRAWSGS
eukprot:366012-Chlamydomonas_euryale.AAC.25